MGPEAAPAAPLAMPTTSPLALAVQEDQPTYSVTDIVLASSAATVRPAPTCLAVLVHQGADFAAWDVAHQEGLMHTPMLCA